MSTVTPFWQYRQASLFKNDKIKKSNVDQCVKDWTRGEELNITVNGAVFDSILTSRGLSAETLTGMNKLVDPTETQKQTLDM